MEIGDKFIMYELKKTDKIDGEYWNIVKGIGIILVVVGHVWIDLNQFIYMFHLPLFFFVSGYLYNEEKYGDDPYLHLANRLKSSWIKYVFLFWLMIWAHNFLLDTKIAWLYPGHYDFKDIVYQMIEALFGNGGESFGTTLWFVPVSVISVSLLGFIVSMSRKLYQYTNSFIVKYGFQTVVIILLAILGYYLLMEKVELAAKTQIAFIVMPFLWVGYLLRNVKIDIKAYLNFEVSMICGIIVYIVSCKCRLDLVMGWIYPNMHIVGFLGIYMCLYLAMLIQKVAKLKDLFGLYGKATFWIMSSHIALCRLFDWAYTRHYYPEDFDDIYRVIDTVIYPDKFLGVYLVVGLGVTLLLYVIYDRIKRRIKCFSVK